MTSARPAYLFALCPGLTAPAQAGGAYLFGSPPPVLGSQSISFDMADNPGTQLLLGILLAILLAFIVVVIYCYRLRPASTARQRSMRGLTLQRPAHTPGQTARHVVNNPSSPLRKRVVLPPPLLRPYPAAFEANPALDLESQEQVIDWLRSADPDFSHLCRLFRSPCDWQEQAAFMRGAAAAYLLQQGMPVGEQACRSLLIHAEEDERFWFVGDIHGSLDALLRLYAYIRHAGATLGGTQHIVLLGDLVDRGLQSLETLAVILHLLTNTPPGLRLTVLRGNHDAGLYAAGDRLDSIVEPAESIDQFNDLLLDPDAERRALGTLMGQAALRLAEQSAVMAEITGLDPAFPAHTILCTHGGLPHTDLQDQLARTEARSGAGNGAAPAADRPYLASIPRELLHAFALDYTWIRLEDKTARRQPNRHQVGCRMGTQDVDSYRLQHWKRSGRALGFIIRGHDHEETGWALSSYDAQHNPARGKAVQRHCGVLTINSMDPDMSVSGLFMKRDIGLASCGVGTPLSLIPLKGMPPGLPKYGSPYRGR